jgi:serine protease inhibitor
MIGRGMCKQIIYYLFFIVLTLWGCEKNMLEPGNPAELRSLTFEEKALIEQSNHVAFEFLSHLNQKDPGNNLFFSPLSIGIALGMMNNGMDHQGNEHFNKLMGFSGSDVQVNKTFSELTSLLKKIDKDVSITLSNSFWHHRKYVMDNIFKDKIMAYYNADAEGVNFESAHTSNYINRVISIKMNKDIEKINYPILENYETLQINAVSFSGKWTYSPEVILNGKKFNGDDNANFEFVRNAIVCVYQDDNNKIIDVPYGNGQYSMTMVMSKQASTSGKGGISFDEFKHYLTNADTARYDLYLPVMGAQYQFNLNDLISKYDIDFPENYNYMFAGPGPKKIDAVMQGAYLDPPLFQKTLPLITGHDFTINDRSLIVDKPFLYFIREKHTGIILFAGKFLSPGS